LNPGGLAEVVEDLVRLLRQKYDDVGIIVSGYSKSTGTVFAMAADETLMGQFSAFGPIGTQILSNGKRFSADVFLMD
jgi:ClpP class serine protease